MYIICKTKFTDRIETYFSFSTLKYFELISEYLIHDEYSRLEKIGPNMGRIPKLLIIEYHLIEKLYNRKC